MYNDIAVACNYNSIAKAFLYVVKKQQRKCMIQDYLNHVHVTNSQNHGTCQLWRVCKFQNAPVYKQCTVMHALSCMHVTGMEEG